MNSYIKKIRQHLAAVIILVAMAGLASCEKYKILPQPFDTTAIWSLKTDIQPIFNSVCIKCHGGSRSPDLREGKSYNSLTKGGFVNSPYETSRLFLQMESGHPSSSLSDVDRKKIQYWTLQGAKNN
jgi:hypothetical protein